MILTISEFLLWMAVVFMAGSFIGFLAMFVLVCLRVEPPPISDAEDWALRMKDREPYRLDLTMDDMRPFLDDDKPHKLRAVK